MLGRRRPDGGKRLGEEGVLLGRPHRDPQRARCAERAHRPHDRALAQERVEKRGSVVADLDEEEVRDRRPGRLEPVLPQRPLELASVRATTT